MKSVKLYLSLLLVLLTLVSCARGDKPTPPQTQPSGPATATFVFPDLSEDVTYLRVTLEPKTDDVDLKTSGTKNSSLNLTPDGVADVLESRFDPSHPGNPTMKLEAQSGSYTLTAYGYEEAGGAVTYSRVEDITLRPGSVAVTAKGAEAPVQTNRKSLRLTPHIPPAHVFEGQEDLPTQSSLQLLSQENFGTLLDVQNIGPNASQPIGEVGRVVANQPYRAHWHEVSFKNSYTDPVVIMNPMSFNGKNPATARIRKVTPTGFEFRIDEWLYQDGRHLEETLSYLVVEKGRHSLGGLVLEAGLTQTDHKFTSVNLDQAFDQTPVILTQSQSFKGAHPVVTRHRNVTLEGFEVRLQEEEAQGWHKVEDVAYVALASQIIGGFAPFEVATTEQVLNRDWLDVDFQNPYETPIFLGSLQTFNGPNTANVRYQNLDSGGVSLRIQEEKSMDAETWHRKEVAGYVVFDSRLELTPFEPEIPTPEIPIPGVPTPGVPTPGIPTPGVPGIPVSDTFGLQLGTYDAQLSDDLALTSYERGDSDFQIFENTVSDSDGSILTEIALRNLGVESYKGLRLVVSDLSDGATFVGQDGITSEGNPYIDAGSLDSDELSSAFLLFDVETTRPFRYTLLIIEAQDAFGITDVSPQNFDNDAEQIITVTGHALTSDTMFFSGGQQLERIEVGSDTQAKLRVPRGYAADTYALSAFKLGNVSTELDGAFNVSEGAAPIQIDPIENYQSFFSGFVIDAVTSNTIPNATVKVESLEGVTGPTGMFLLQGAPIGTFTLSITAPGYTSAQRTVEITQSDETVFTEAVYLTPVDTERSFQTQSLPGCDIGISSIQPTFSTLSGGFSCGKRYPAGSYTPAPDYEPLDESVGKRRRSGRWIQVSACVQYADGPASGVYTNFGRTNAEGIVESWHYLPSKGKYGGAVELKLQLATWENTVAPITTTFNPATASNAAFECLTIPGNSNPNWDEFDVLEKLDSSCSVNDTYSSASLSNHSYQSPSQISTLNSDSNRPSPLLIRDQTRGFRGVIRRWDRRRFRGGKAVFEVEGNQVPYKLVYPHPDYKDSPLDLRNVQRNAAVVTANPRLPTGKAISVKFGARTGDRGVVSTNEYTFDIIERIVAPKVLVLALPDNAIPDSIRTPYTVESSTNLGGQEPLRSDYGGYVGTVPSDSDSTFVPPPAGIGTTRPDEGTPNADGNVSSSVTILFRESDLAADGTAEVYVPITAVGGSDSPLPDIDTNVAFAFANVDSDAKPLIGGRAEIPVRVDLRNGGKTDLSKLVVVDDIGYIGIMSIGTQSVSFGDCIETHDGEGDVPTLVASDEGLYDRALEFYEDIPLYITLPVGFFPFLLDGVDGAFYGPGCIDQQTPRYCVPFGLAGAGASLEWVGIGTVATSANQMVKASLRLSRQGIGGAISDAVYLIMLKYDVFNKPPTRTEATQMLGEIRELMDNLLDIVESSNSFNIVGVLENADVLTTSISRTASKTPSEALEAVNVAIGKIGLSGEFKAIDFLKASRKTSDIPGFNSVFDRIVRDNSANGSNAKGAFNEILHAKNVSDRGQAALSFPGELKRTINGTPVIADVDVATIENGVRFYDDVKSSLRQSTLSGNTRNQAERLFQVAQADGSAARWVIVDASTVNQNAVDELRQIGLEIVDSLGNPL